MAGQLTIDTLKTSSGVLATQNGMTGICKAWINANGVNGSVAINGSFNVSSFTRNTTGDYTINFTTTLDNANYCVVTGTNTNSSSSCSIMGPSIKTSSTSAAPTLKSTTQLGILAGGISGTQSTGDVSQVNIAIFG